ncbi:MAG: ribosomal-processing cysteine protease Prp [Ruminococcaceae bacterium]|nr:ribosomal-processing cysteine protease Prp [Oscillospiraceae bacterium]
MIRVRFQTDDGLLTGFSLSGHAGAGEYGQDIVCAAVSSAAYMTANTITDIVGAPADITVDDGRMELTVTALIEDCQDVLSGFQLHIQTLSEAYPKRIQCH